ncbi:hypothetical protein FBU30_008690 [Linnemannia zychae]|nr:hypothetical protein FBU30_008690 [Linnemannia zychae]
MALYDNQYRPTKVMIEFTEAVFTFLDTHFEPKGTQLLEPEKMKAFIGFLTPNEQLPLVLPLASMILNVIYLAFKVETVFTSYGPAVTRAGFSVFLSSEILSDPDDAYTNFQKANQMMRIRPPFARWHFPRTAEPKAKELSSFVNTSVANITKDMRWRNDSTDERLEALKIQHALEERGQQAALDLISPSICYRCRRNIVNSPNILFTSLLPFIKRQHTLGTTMNNDGSKSPGIEISNSQRVCVCFRDTQTTQIDGTLGGDVKLFSTADSTGNYASGSEKVTCNTQWVNSVSFGASGIPSELWIIRETCDWY